MSPVPKPHKTSIYDLGIPVGIFAVLGLCLKVFAMMSGTGDVVATDYLLLIVLLLIAILGTLFSLCGHILLTLRSRSG